MAATKLGAADFIQKPFSVTGLLAAIARVLDGGDAGPVPRQRRRHSARPTESPIDGTGGQRARGVSAPSRARLSSAGRACIPGLRTGVILHPAPVGFGIVFASLSDETQIPVQIENVTDTGYNTTLASGARSVRTVEHLMSALHGFGITNLLIKTDDEIPALDGSASEFCRQIAEAGVRIRTRRCSRFASRVRSQCAARATSS